MSAICDAIGPLVRGSSRLIFVVLCAGLAGAQVLYMINISGYGLVNSMAPGVVGGAHYLLAIGFFLLATLGAYATLIGHREHLKAFTLGSVIYTVIAIALVYYTMGPGNAADINKSFMSKFNNSAADYKWNTGTNEATNLIDSVQSSLKCCGTTGFEFWKQYQKAPITSDEWPGSCCEDRDKDQNLCPKSKVQTRGCLEQLSSLEKSNVLTFIVFILFLIVLCLISLCVKNSL